MAGLYVLIGLVALLFVAIVLMYNRLVQKRQMVSNGWSDIDVQLKRRSNLIPNLVETVKAYAGHERELFAEITAKRTAAASAGDNLDERAQAENALSQPVGRLMAVAEAYPDLKASENFRDLQKELSDTETRIEMARRFYNGAVREYNIVIQTVPSNLIAGPFGFRLADYFEIETSERAMPDVSFGASS